jgi:hypothetical protein
MFHGEGVDHQVFAAGKLNASGHHSWMFAVANQQVISAAERQAPER